MRNPKSQIPNPKDAGESGPRDGARKPYDLKERTFRFALRILHVAALLPRTTEGNIVRRQIVRSGTSIGANVEEADGSGTRAEKRRGFTIARKEARETRYWLRIIERRWGSPDVGGDIAEAAELVLILSSIVSKLE